MACVKASLVKINKFYSNNKANPTNRNKSEPVVVYYAETSQLINTNSIHIKFQIWNINSSHRLSDYVLTILLEFRNENI